MNMFGFSGTDVRNQRLRSVVVIGAQSDHDQASTNTQNDTE
jgi:hypothetical protein